MYFNFFFLFIIVSIIVGTIFLYTFYKKLFTGVQNINTNLIISELINLTVVFILGVFIYTLYSNINFETLGLTTIYCDSDIKVLANLIINYIVNSVTDFDGIMVTLSHLEYLQDIVGVPNNGYDIDYKDQKIFIEMLFQSQILDVEERNGVFLNVIKINDLTLTVHPSLITFILRLLEDILY